MNIYMLELLRDMYEYLTHYEDTFTDAHRSALIDRVVWAMNEIGDKE